MATMTGTNLLASIMDSTGITPNALLQSTLSAKLQQMIDNGTYSKLAAAIATSGFSTEINAATEISALSDSVEANKVLIEAAADEAAVAAIDFADVATTTPVTGDITITTPAAQEENTAVTAGTVIATVTVEAGSTYALSGADAAMFSVDQTTGEITATSEYTPDYETQASYAFTVTGTAVDSSTKTSDVTVAVTDVTEVVIDGGTFELTKESDDVLNGTSDSDLFTAAQGTLQGGDIILDNSTTDNDLFQATVTSTNTEPRLQNIERVEITGEYVGVGLDLGLSSNITTLTLDTKIANGTASILDANSLNAANIVVGDNIKTLNVTSLASGTRDAVTIDANNAEAVNIKGSGSPDVYDVTVAADATLTLDIAAAGDTLASAGDIVTVTVAGDLAIDASVTADNAELDLNIVANTAAAEVTLSDVTHINAENMAISGSQDVTIVTTDGVALAGNVGGGVVYTYDGTAITSTSTGTTTLEVSALAATATTAGNDYSQAQVDVFELSGAIAGSAGITLNDSTKLLLTADHTAANDLTIGLDNGDKDTAYVTGTVVVDVSEKQAGNLITAATVETILVEVKADKAIDTDLDENGTHETTISLADIQLDAVTTALVLNGSENIALSKVTVAVADQTITASNLTGNLTISEMIGAFDATIIGGQGNDTIFTKLGEVYDIQTGTGNDYIDILTTTAAAIGTEVDAGAGNDTVISSTTAVTIDLGAGDDKITTSGADTITVGTGSDTVKLGENASSINVLVKDFVKGTDVVTITGAAITALVAFDLSDVAVDANGLYAFTNDDAVSDAAGEWSLTLKNNDSAITATDMTDSINLYGVTLLDGSVNKLGDLSDSVIVAATKTATVTTGDGSDSVTIAVGAASEATVKDFTVGSDKMILTGAITVGLDVNLKNVTDTAGKYLVGDATLGHSFILENDGSDITTDNDLTSIVQLGDSGTSFTVTGVNATPAAVTVTGGIFNDYITLLSDTAAGTATFNFSDNGGVDTVTVTATTAGENEELFNFNTLTGIDSAQGKNAVAADAAKIADATDSAIYVFADSSNGTGSSKITTMLADTNNGYTQAIVDDEIAAFIDAAIGVSAGESYVVVINDQSTATYAATAYGTITATQHDAYAYLVTGDSDGVQADNITLIGNLNHTGTGTGSAGIVDTTDIA